MKNFIIGKIYSCRSAFDHECIFEFLIISRTSKTIDFVEIEEGQKRKIKRKKIFLDESGNEYFLPVGSYSFAPILRA